MVRSLWGRWALHAWGWGAPGSCPHSRTEAPGLVEGWTKGALVFGKLLHGSRIVVMWGRGIDGWGWSAVLGGWTRRWVVHIRGHLTQDVPRRRGDWRWGIGHGRGRGLVVDHVWCTSALWVLHGMSDWRGWRRGRSKVLLGQEVVRVRDHGRLRGLVFSRVVVRWLGWPRPSSGVVLNGHRDEVAVLSGGYRRDAEGLRAKRSIRRGLVVRSWGRLAIGVVGRPVRQVGVVFGQVRRRNSVPVGVVGGGKVQWVLSAPTGRGLGCPHVAVVDVSLKISL